MLFAVRMVREIIHYLNPLVEVQGAYLPAHGLGWKNLPTRLCRMILDNRAFISYICTIYFQATNQKAMKKIFILSLLLSLYFPIFSQVYDVFSDFDKWEQTNREFESNPIEDALEIFEPGLLPEGDLIGALAYSTDGGILAALYLHTDNIYFYNTTSFALLAIVDVGREPMDITLSNQSAYVCCHTSNELYIISLTDFSISSSFEVHENPCQVEIKPDETMVYIGFNSSMGGSVAAYNPTKGEEIFQIFEPYIREQESSNSLGRKSRSFTFFSLSPHSNYIVAINSSGQRLSLFNDNTGDLVKTFNFGTMKGSGFSETGDTLYIHSAQSQESVSLHRVKLNDFSVIDSIVALTTFSSGIKQIDLAINANGTKVLTADAPSNNRYCLYDFNTHDYQYIDDANMIRVMSKMFTTNDKRYAIYRSYGWAKIIDLETAQIISRLPVGYFTGIAGAMSPIADKIAFGDGPSYWYYLYPEEKFTIFDIGDPTDIVVDTVIISGVAPEADVTNSAVLSIDGTKLIASNKLTQNISIIDYSSGQLDTLIYMEAVADVKTIPKTELILASGSDAINIYIIDLENNEIILELFTGLVDKVYMKEDGKYAYLFKRVSSTMASMTKIALDGASSEIDGFLQVGHKGCSFNLSSSDAENHIAAALSPDGKYMLIGALDDSQAEVVHIVDTEIMEVVKTIPVGDSNNDCTFSFAFTDDSKRACALFNPQMPIIYLDGESSFIESEVNINHRSFSAAYNPIDGLFYILLRSDSICQVNPENGEIVGIIPTTPDTYIQINISQSGIPLLRSLNHLLFNDVIYPLPGVSQDFSYNIAYDLFIIPITGPDKICVFNPLVAGVKMYREPTIDDGIVLFPNPASGEVFINSENTIENISIYTLAGKLVFSKACNKLSASVSVGNYKEGAYLVVIKNTAGIATRKFIVVH